MAKKPEMTYEEQLQCMIVLNTKAVVVSSSEDFIDIRIDLKYSPFLMPVAKYFGARESKICRISGFGCEIYRLIAKGPIKVIDLVYYLRDTQKLSFFEARNLILQYTGMLMRNGIIAVESLKTR